MFAVCLCQSNSLAHDEAEGVLGFTFDNTYSSKYMWRGYDLFGANGAYMPSLDADLFGTGWSINV